MNTRGRPVTKPSVSLVIWLMIELRRDQQGRPNRRSVRDATQRVEKDLADSFKGGRVLPFDTVRRHYKSFWKTMQSNGRAQAQALHMLERGRLRRESFGWDATSWLFVFDPEDWASLGFDVSIDGRQILATRPRSAAAD